MIVDMHRGKDRYIRHTHMAHKSMDTRMCYAMCNNAVVYLGVVALVPARPVVTHAVEAQVAL